MFSNSCLKIAVLLGSLFECFSAHIRILPKRQYVKRNESARFACSSTDNIDNYLWSLNNHLVTSHNAIHSGSKLEIITILHVREKDIGFYTCQGYSGENIIHNAAGYLGLRPDSSNASFQIDPDQYTANQGAAATFTCFVDGAAFYIWGFNNDYNLNLLVRVGGVLSQDLTVTLVNENNVGTYKCIAIDFDGAEIVSTTAVLRMNHRSAGYTCSSLDNPQNGQVIVNKYNVAEYSCGAEFKLRGLSIRKCSHGIWEGRAPICGPKSHNCSVLQLTNGKVKIIPVGYIFSAIYTCDYGYELHGNSVRYCVDNKWSGKDSTCKEGVCTNFENFENGTVKTSKVKNGYLATFSCNKGYVLAGNKNRTCFKGMWNKEPPFCVLPGTILCSSLKNPANGAVSIGKLSATYKCDFGYTIVGTSALSCEKGKWSGIPPDCVTECPQLLSPVNGIVTIKYTMSNAFAVYSCNEKYALKGNSDRTCTNQEWDGIEPECIHAVACANLQPIRDGHSYVHKKGAESVTTFTCDDGYFLVGSFNRVCDVSTGSWTGDQPICVYLIGGNIKPSTWPLLLQLQQFFLYFLL